MINPFVDTDVSKLSSCAVRAVLKITELFQHQSSTGYIHPLYVPKSSSRAVLQRTTAQNRAQHRIVPWHTPISLRLLNISTTAVRVLIVMTLCSAIRGKHSPSLRIYLKWFLNSSTWLHHRQCRAQQIDRTKTVSFRQNFNNTRDILASIAANIARHGRAEQLFPSTLHSTFYQPCKALTMTFHREKDESKNLWVFVF